MVKRRLSAMAGFLLAAALIIGGPGFAGAAPSEPGGKITIRLSHDYPVTYIRHKSVLKWKELLEKESNGQVEVKVFPAGQLVKGRAAIEAVILDTVDMVATHGGMISTIVPTWDLFVMPFFWPNDGKNFESAMKFKNSEIVKKLLIPKVEQKGIKFVGFVNAFGGASSFTTMSRQVRTVADFKGLKLNTSAGWLRYETINALGAACVSLPVSELSMALTQGTIDGEIGTTTNALASGYPTKYVHAWPSFCNDTGSSFLMSMKKWNSLPGNIKKIIETSATPQVQAWTNKEIIVEEATAIEELKKRGKVIVDPAPGTLDECKKRTEPLIEAFVKKYGGDARELLDQAKAMIAQER